MNGKKYVIGGSYLLAVVGALNWGLVGLANVNLVTAVFGAMPTLITLTYTGVGAAGLIVGLHMLKVVK